MKKINTYDSLVENLISNLKKNDNSHLITEGEGLELYANFSVKISEFYSIKKLFFQYYIPATNRAAAEDYKEYRNSKYQEILKIQQAEFKSSYYELIRLGYVTLFHKIESFLNETISQVDKFYQPLCDNQLSLKDFAKTKFDFGFKDWKNSPTISKINWVTNCIKHYDGLPIKEPIDISFIESDKSERIKIDQDIFKRDIESAITYCSINLNIAFLIGASKMVGIEYSMNENESILELIGLIKEI